MIALLDSKFVLKVIRTDDASVISTLQVERNTLDVAGTLTYAQGHLYWSHPGLHSWTQEKEK